MIQAVDLFAGLGGFTQGAEDAGIRVVWAANHWKAAVDIHRLNHPAVAHSCQDLHQADWGAIPAHDLLLASPACQGHSLARGHDKPTHDAARSTAWAVVSCAEVHRPPRVVIENVPEFIRWQLYGAWCAAMEALGYTLSPHILDAADYGVPQNRRRLIIIATRSRAKLLLTPSSCAHQPISEHIQWDRGPWRRIDWRLVERTRQRISNGRKAFGERFVMPYYSHGSGLTGRSVKRPIGTITTKDRWAVVKGRYMRMLNVDECRAAMSFKPTYHLPGTATLAKHMLGNAVPPLMITKILREIVH